MPSVSQIRSQSENAYNQWCKQWREHAKIHSKMKMNPLTDFANVGIGRAVLCVANGYSLEENIETIKELQHNVHILACDKSMGHLLNHGIKPTYVLVCDANVNFEKYCEPWKDQLQDTILFSNVCGNPKWTHDAKWKGMYFFANEDVLESEKEFMRLSGCPNKIPAATNVSNAMVVLLTQSDNTGRRNFFGYDKILLIGFDYSWRHDGHYYSFEPDGNGKHNYMRHLYTYNLNNNLVYTSTNLAFSAQWLEKYVSTFKLPVVQCSKDSILNPGYHGNLREQMQYKFKPHDRDIVNQTVTKRANLLKELAEADRRLNRIGAEHARSFSDSV